MVTEGYLLSENVDIGVAHRAVDIMREIIASRQLQGGESSVKRKM